MLHYAMRRKDTAFMEKILNEMVQKNVAFEISQFNRVLNYLEALSILRFPFNLLSLLNMSLGI